MSPTVPPISVMTTSTSSVARRVIRRLISSVIAAVVGDEHLAVLERVHGARIDVEVRVELLHRDPQTPALQQPAER